jgi:hypothetical protein
MSKGQLRSNREARKPKQPKIPPKSQSPFGSQVKMAGIEAVRGKPSK